MYQCYYTDKEGKRCKESWLSIEDVYIWCSKEHENLYKAVNYIDNRGKQTHQLPIEVIQKRLIKIGKTATLNDKTDEKGQMLIIPKSESKQTEITAMFDH